jgi:hypothetical protein
MNKILLLLFSSFFVLPTKAQDNTFKHTIDSLIQNNIEKDIFKEAPVIIIDGYALVDSLKANKVFKFLIVSDIESIDIITYDKASELFGSKDGVLIIKCKKSGTKKIKQIFKD